MLSLALSHPPAHLVSTACTGCSPHPKPNPGPQPDPHCVRCPPPTQAARRMAPSRPHCGCVCIGDASPLLRVSLPAWRCRCTRVPIALLRQLPPRPQSIPQPSGQRSERPRQRHRWLLPGGIARTARWHVHTLALITLLTRRCPSSHHGQDSPPIGACLALLSRLPRWALVYPLLCCQLLCRLHLTSRPHVRWLVEAATGGCHP